MSDNSKVFGHAQVKGTSRITGSSQVSGGMELENVITSGNAKLCLSYRIKDKIVNDDFHCSNSTISELALSVMSYSEEKINTKTRDLILYLKENAFSTQPNAVKVLLNQTLLTEGFIVRRGSVTISSELLQTGKNTVVVTGDGTSGQKFSSKEFQFYISTEKRMITLVGAEGFDGALVKVIYFQEADSFEAQGRVVGGILEIDSPPHEDFTHMKVLAVSQHYALYEEIILEDSESFPAELTPLPLSPLAGKLVDFSSSMAGWSVSDSSRIIFNNDASKSISLVSSSESDLTISKIVKLPKHITQLSFQVSPLSAIEDEVVDTSLVHLLIPLDKQSFNNLDISQPTKSRFEEQVVETFKESGEIKDFIVLFNLKKSKVVPDKACEDEPGRSCEDDKDVYQIGSGELFSSPFRFMLRNFGVTNKTSSVELNPVSSAIFGESCVASSFNTARANLFEAETQPLKFISVNYKNTETENSMSGIKYNRIWGQLKYLGHPFTGSIPNVEFHLKKTLGGISIANSKLSTCAQQALARFSDSGLADLAVLPNLVSPLMEFDFEKYAENEFGGNDKIFVEMIVPASEKFPGASYSKEYPVLVPLKIDPKHYNKEKIDTYNRSGSGYTRTGGDKWIRPGYQDVFKNSLTKPYIATWQVNDLSMLNGANFGHTKTHEQGIDGDYSYGTYNFKNFGNDHSAWRSSLNKIEDFLLKMDYKYLKDVVIQYRSEKYQPQYIVSQFQNRCMTSCRGQEDCDSMYINLDKKAGKRSLLRNAPPHSDHLHVRFNNPEKGKGQPAENKWKNNLNPNFISDLKMSIDIDPVGEFFLASIKPERVDAYKGKTVYWRYQDKKTFQDFNMKLCAGDTTLPVYDPASMVQCGSPMASGGIRYLYFMLVDNSTGECVVAKTGEEEFIAIDIKDEQSFKWLNLKLNKLEQQW